MDSTDNGFKELAASLNGQITTTRELKTRLNELKPSFDGGDLDKLKEYLKYHIIISFCSTISYLNNNELIVNFLRGVRNDRIRFKYYQQTKQSA